MSEAAPVEPESHTTSFKPIRIALAWGVHLFTALGAVVALVALLEIAYGDLASAAMWMLAALVIDSADGTMARKVGVKDVVPAIDGRRLDDMIDFANYVIVPVVFMLAAGDLPHWSVAALPVLASCYGFSQVAAKTDDHFFLGFPSYWNFVALYAWGLGASMLVTTAVVVLFSALVFVPFRYAYLSMLPPRQRWFNAGLAVAWLIAFATALVIPDRVEHLHLLGISLVYPAYYFALSWWLVRKSDAAK